MASLQDYVTKQFPNHEIEVLEPTTTNDLQLTDNTVVSFVVGSKSGLELLSTFRQSAPDARVAAVSVKPSDPTVLPQDGEDRDGVVDLPVRRIGAYVLIGIAAFGLIGILLATLTADSGVTTAIAGCFAAVVGGVFGAIVGGSRLAGERANTQPRAPGRTITVVAAFLDDDASAATFARSVGPAADYEVRILDHEGGWRSPGAEHASN